MHSSRRHLGDLWAKTDVPGYAGNYSSPSQHGFDEWVQTEAEASNSMPNCGCFPVNHTHPGPKPPSGYPMITPHGDQCVVGGGVKSDWCYPCTNYYRPNASDPRGVSEWVDKIPGNDAVFIVDRRYSARASAPCPRRRCGSWPCRTPWWPCRPCCAPGTGTARWPSQPSPGPRTAPP